MDLSDLHSPRTGRVPNGEQAAEQGFDAYALVARVGSEIAGPLTTAVERVCQLGATGRIDRHGLRALQIEIEQARQAAMLAQQIARYARGSVRQSRERVNLAQALSQVLAHHPLGLAGRGLQFRQSARPAEVIADPGLLSSLIATMFDWALMLARSPIDVGLDHKSRPGHARLCCRFAHRSPDEAQEVEIDAARFDSLSWRLVEQIACAMGVLVERREGPNVVALALEFPRTVNEQLEGMSAIELDPGADAASACRLLAGAHVLVLAPNPDMRASILGAISHMGLIVDVVSTLDEARDFCSSGLPHAMVHAMACAGEAFDALRREVLQQAPGFVFIEIAEKGDAYQVSGFEGASGARIGIDAVASGLPCALVYELSKNL